MSGEISVKDSLLHMPSLTLEKLNITQEKITSPEKIKIIQTFCQSPSKINTPNECGWTPLYRTVIAGNLKATELLIQNGANPNIKSSLGETPLYQSVEMNQIEHVKLLLKYNSDPNISNIDGMSPLHLAVVKQEVLIVKLLLKYKSNPNLKTKLFEQTPVHLAIKGNVDPTILLLLIQYNGSLVMKDKSGKRPIDYVNSEEMRNALKKLKLQKEDIFKSPGKNLYNTPCKNNWTINQVYTNTITSEKGKRNIELSSKAVLQEPGNVKVGIIDIRSSNLDDGKIHLKDNLNNNNIISHNEESGFKKKLSFNDLDNSVIKEHEQEYDIDTNKDNATSSNNKVNYNSSENKGNSDVKINEINEKGNNMVEGEKSSYKTFIENKSKNSNLIENKNFIDENKNNKNQEENLNFDDNLNNNKNNNNNIKKNSDKINKIVNDKSDSNNKNGNISINLNNNLNDNKSNESINNKDKENEKRNISINVNYDKNDNKINNNLDSNNKYKKNKKGLNKKNSFNSEKKNNNMNIEINVKIIDNSDFKKNKNLSFTRKINDNEDSDDESKKNNINNIFTPKLQKIISEEYSIKKINSNSSSNKENNNLNSNLNSSNSNTKDEFTNTIIQNNKNNQLFNTIKNNRIKCENVYTQTDINNTYNNTNSFVSSKKSLITYSENFQNKTSKDNLSKFSTKPSEEMKYDLNNKKSNIHNHYYVTNKHNHFHNHNKFSSYNTSSTIPSKISNINDKEEVEYIIYSNIIGSEPKNIMKYICSNYQNIDINEVDTSSLYQFLKSIDLLCYYKLIISKGIFSFDKVISDLKKGKYKISFNDIEELGINNPGHIYRIITKLEVDSEIIPEKISKVLLKFHEIIGEKEDILTSSIQLNCGYNCCSTGPKKQLISSNLNFNLDLWLKKIKLSHLKENFNHNGFDKLEFLTLQMFSSYPINDYILKNDLYIYKENERDIIIFQLNRDIKSILKRIDKNNLLTVNNSKNEIENNNDFCNIF